MGYEYCTVLTTYSDKAVGKRIIDSLLQDRLAACVQTVEINSSYRWKGQINNDPESLLLIKTKTSLYPEVERTIKANHDYEVPEIIQLPILAGYAPYLKWIDDECR